MSAIVTKIKNGETITWNEPVTFKSLIEDFETNLLAYQNIITYRSRYVSSSHAEIAKDLRLSLDLLKDQHAKDYNNQATTLIEKLEEIRINKRGWLGAESYLYQLIRMTIAQYGALAKKAVVGNGPSVETLRELERENLQLQQKNQQLQTEVYANHQQVEYQNELCEKLAEENKNLLEQAEIGKVEKQYLNKIVNDFEPKIEEALKLREENKLLRQKLNTAKEENVALLNDNEALLEDNKQHRLLWRQKHDKNRALTQELNQVKQENRDLKSTVKRLEARLASLAANFASKITGFFTSKKIPLECKIVNDADLQLTAAGNNSIMLSTFFQSDKTFVKTVSDNLLDTELGLGNQKKTPIISPVPC